MPTRYSTFLNESLWKQQKILPICRFLKAEDIRRKISAAIFFVTCYRHSFCGSKLYSLFIWCLHIWSLTYKGLGIYPKWTIYMLCLTTLDWSASILWSKQLMNFLHSVLFTVAMGSGFSLLSAAILTVSKIDPAVIGPSHKICEILPLLSPNILYHHILPLSRFLENYEGALQTLWNPGYGEKSFVCPLLNWPAQVSYLFGVGRGPQI